MVIAYHAIFSTYGFWLPNDPRGSWSEFKESKPRQHWSFVIPYDG